MTSTVSPRSLLHTESSIGFGGQEIRILQEARWLLAHGWNVLVVGQPGSPLLREAAPDIPHHALAMRHALDVRAFLDLRDLMRERRIDVVHTHSSTDSWLATLAARSRRRPVVRSRHVAIPVKRRRALVYHLADRVITSGETIKTVLREAGVPLRKMVSIPAGIDLARFHPGVSGAGVRASLGIPGPLVGLVANLRSSKGHRFFVDAAAEVLRELPESRFLIVGDGVAREPIRRYVEDRGLGKEVLMTGFRRDIPEVMAALDVLVLPSIRSEATSQVIPQALAVGTPVVATAVGGIPEIVVDGHTGRLVPAADTGALSAAIVAMLRDPAAARAMARRGGALVRERLSFDAMMERTAAVYAELLA
ncbi:MAG: glycosyltransferase [Candidatus Rokuibacteriota bacterium]